MANPEHVKIVKQGVEAINKWQNEHLGLGLDLSRECFSLFKLSGANFRDANLEGSEVPQK